MLTIYGKLGCPFCVKAVELLDMIDIDYEYWDVNDLPTAREFLKAEGWTTVPAIYSNFEKIDGYTGLQAILRGALNDLEVSSI